MKIGKENLKQIIKESLKRICEEQHISQTAGEWVDRVYEYIVKNYQNIKFMPHPFAYDSPEGTTKFNEYRVGSLYFTMEPFSEVKATIFDFNKLNDVDIFLRHEKFDSKYYSNNKKIELLLISINGKLLEKFDKKTVSHEVRHAFDSLKSGIDTRKLYYRAKATMEDFSGNKDDVNYLIASLIYWFTDEEINANCQGLYGELKIGDIKTFAEAKEGTNVYSEFLYLNNLDNYLFNTFNNEISWFDKRYFLNMSLGRINGYLRKQINYAKKRLDKVVYYYLKEKKYVNENFTIKTLPFLNPIL